MTELDPIRKAIAAGGSVARGHIDRLARATLDDLGLDASAFQWAVLKRGDDHRGRRRFLRRHWLRLLAPPDDSHRGRKGPDPEAIPNYPSSLRLRLAAPALTPKS